METQRRTRVKICCITTLEEARLAIAHGADALGLVSEMPSGPGVIPEERIAEIAAAVPPPIATFLLTSRNDVDGIVEQVRRCGTNTVQLCDQLEPGDHQRLAAALPGIRIVQVVHVTGEDSVAEAYAVGPHVHALLLDSGKPDGDVKELGGTGRIHDWRLSRRIVEGSPVPVFLAGGLRAVNISEAIRQVGPFGVDLCSGVRANGELDTEKLGRFYAALVWSGFG